MGTIVSGAGRRAYELVDTPWAGKIASRSRRYLGREAMAPNAPNLAADMARSPSVGIEVAIARVVAQSLAHLRVTNASPGATGHVSRLPADDQVVTTNRDTAAHNNPGPVMSQATQLEVGLYATTSGVTRC